MNTYLLTSSLLGAAAILFFRLREATRPVTLKKIVIPPLGMSGGFGMFAYSPARIPLHWGLMAFALGVCVFAYPLVKSSKLEREGDVIMLKRSHAFLWIIVGLFAVRFVARDYVSQHIDPLQTAGLFFVLAFGMVLTWRARMLVEFRKLAQTTQSEAELSHPQ